MKRTLLIRLGGLAAMVGGVAYATLELTVWYVEPLHSWGVQFLDNIFFVFLVLGALAAIAALHTLHTREFHGMTETLVSLIAFVGLTLILVGGLGDVLRTLQRDTDALWYFTPLFWGLWLAGLGGAGLGVVTIAARVLPWWSGVALMVGSPGFAAAGLFGGLWAALAGVAWALVGYVVFRAARRLPEQPLRVR